ncbi:retention module-containing protein [Pseudomonas sp. TNT3]|uniref:retention module-containing protein n=1 Tax=Pseudomonas sp. TNT3 TaxID=2654097 RepID=UPI001FF4D038|nr:retention module-containing protein [Pseudomonas sp. TNT3]KAI2693653.1 retention module-containing protein [Pseudomonas sp. TNT3]
MATLIGTVSKVIGQVFAVAGDGTRRALVEGDRLFAGDQLVTGAEGAVAVHLKNGQELTLGRDSSLQMTSQLLANQVPHVDSPEIVTPSEAQLTDVEQLQKAIAAGEDPTQTGEATAAGPSGANGSGALGGGHSFVLLEEVAGRVDPTIGFPTAGFNGIPEFPLERHFADLNDNVNDDAPPVIVPPPPVNNPVTLGGLNSTGGELTLNEANLPDGSASNPAALTQNGTFTVNAADGLLNLSIGGISVLSGGVASGFPQSITTQLGNTLTINGYNPATGVVSYSYTLNGNDTHSAGDGANNLSEQFTVVASDTNGDTATGTLDINITDDAPKAVDDSNANTASETLVTLTGSVLPNDTQGADRIPTGPNSGPVIGGTFTGMYGTLVLNPNGTYTYTLNTDDADFKALHGGGSGTENFVYTLTDSDGDTSTATLVLNIHNNDDPVTIGGLGVFGGEVTVYEKNLGDGSAPDSTALTQSGTFTITALDGVQTLSIGGINVVVGGVSAGFPQSVVTPLGSTLTVTGFDPATGVVSYSYTLADNESHPNANGTNNLPEQFAVTVVDDNGTTANGTLDVNIVDDVPKAVDDSNAGTASETLLSLNGNVLTNDVQGADRVVTGENAGPITPGTFTGVYGTLVLNANGTYTYTLNISDADFKALHGGGDGTETFAYTITDSDGDTSTANLVLQIHNNDDPVTIDGLSVNGGELTVYEKNLGDGSAPDANALTQSGTFTITALDGVQTLSIGGINVVVGGVSAGFPQSVVTPLGSTLTVTGFDPATGVVSYSYTLADNETHPNANGTNNLPEQFAVTVVDDNGTTANGTLDVNIVDDVPKAVDDSNAGTASETLLSLNGNVLTNDVQGADRVVTGENAGPITPGTFTGVYGTLVLNANGTYTYTLNISDADFKALHGGGDGTETFAYTITDSDGDTSTANLVLQIHNNDDPVTIDGLSVNGGELTVYEKNLGDGSAPDSTALTQSGTFTITALDGVQTLSIGGINVVVGGVSAGFPQSVVTPLGSTLTVTGFDPATGVVSYSYTLADNETHPNANGTNNLPEQFAVTVVDDNGTTANGTLDVNIVDDVPKGVDDSNAGTASETLLSLSGNVLTNDVQGADRVVTGENAGPITPGTFTGVYGTLVLNANGTYTYTLNISDADFKALHGGGDGTETFAYTITDSDGDTSTANLVLQIHNNDDPVTIGGLNVNGGELTVYEKNLDWGTSPDTPALTQTGTFTVTALDGLQTLTVGGYAVMNGGVVSGLPHTIVTPLGSYLTITGFDQVTGVVSYSYTLVGSETHPNADGANSISENFQVVATDSDGSSASGEINVNIVDDLPSAKPDSAHVDEGGTVSGNVLDNDIGGSDGPAASGAVVGVRAGSDTSTSASGGLNTNINGAYGYLTLDANGNATYHSNPNSVGTPGATDVFTYTVRDADGDESTTTITIDVCNSKILAASDTDVTVFEKALDLTKDGNDLAAGTVAGSEPGNTGETASGTLVGSVTGAVGAITYALVGSATGNYGQIQLNADGTYTYTLTSPASTTPHANDGANTLTESFTYLATDSLGNTTSSTIVVSIVDDVPKAVDDTNAKTASESLVTLDGNVLTNDVQGADRVVTGDNAGPVTPGTFNGVYGSLVLNANGTYTYTLNTSDADFKGLKGGGNGTETFTYTLTDSDGDTSTANLVLQIHNNDDPVVIGGLNVNGGEVTVYEKNLGWGTSPDTPALTQTGTFTVTALDGLQTLTVGGYAVMNGGVVSGLPHTIVTPLGSYLTITGFDQVTGVVSYSYTLVGSETHPNADGANSISENFQVVATDSDGSSASGEINVNIVDDLPSAKPDSAHVNEGGTVSGNVLDNDIGGSDGPAVGGAVVGVRAGGNTSTSVSGGLNTNINGNYGYLTLDANGNATYHSNPNSVGTPGATDVFTYTVRDADGDESTTTITIDVCNSKLLAASDTDVTVFEKALDLTKDGNDLAAGTVIGSEPGNTGETSAGTLVGSVTGASGAVTYTLVSNATGTYGQMLLNADGTYTYTLTSAPKTSPNANDGANTLSESFTYKATDALGNSTTSTIVVNIVDDVPKAAASERAVAAVEIDSNLLLVIDVSGSMADASGVPGLSRLALAKQAISALLDKYDDLGDVKVQIVTFSSNATDKTSIWVDVATAKSIISGLTAGGGTNYDAAVATMKQAFDTAGKLTGAQNIGYFFSDGKPNEGDISASDEASLKAFLDANGIKNYAIGLGSGVSNAYLDPVAYDGSTHTNTNAVVVTDLNQLNSVLSGTVQGAPVTGTLLEGGTFGADGGFIKTIVVDGTTYTYDPKDLGNQGSLKFTGGANHGTFNTVDNSLSIATNNGGTLVIKLDTGEYSYTSQKATSVVITENIGFTVSDNDGDLASSTLVVKVVPNAAPVAVDDHIITNVLSSSVVVPGELLLANDTDPEGDPLTATPTTFNTGWAAKGADFVGTGAKGFSGTGNTAANQNLADVRALFAANTAAMTAVLVVSGYLGGVTTANANDEDLITVKLKEGETLNLDHNLAAGRITLEYSLNGGPFVSIADGGTITAAADGTYQIHVTNINNGSGSNPTGAENYQLKMTVNYAGAHDITPDAHGSYTANDSHGGSDGANVTISYQDGHTLTGTAGDDVLVAGTGNNILNAGDGNDVLTAGSGNNELHGGAGNDLLFSGTGNDLLDGGAGIDTVSYAHATSGVTVDLSLLTAQTTGGAGTDTLTGLENLTGSNFNDNLTGDNNSNVINGGLGDDILNGGGGDDFLIGGLGNNTLTGGAGADTFQWLKGNSGHDLVTDFTPGTDKLDLSQLLQGENGTTASLDDYLHFKVVGSGASVLTSIDVSAMAGATPNQTIDLAGVNLASHYGVTPGAGGVVAGGHDTATIINGMLNDHSLKVDTV